MLRICQRLDRLMGELVRLEPRGETARLTERMRALCAALDHPHDESRPLDLLNRMQETLDALYEEEYARRKERC